MKVSTWLVIELRNKNNWSGEIVPFIAKARQTRPINEMAVKVTLDIDPAALQPQVEALIEAGLLTLQVETPDAAQGEGEG